MTRTRVKPYLISKSDTGEFHITVRQTRFNSQGYPLVSSERLSTTFRTITAARTHLKAEHRAEATDIATA